MCSIHWQLESKVRTVIVHWVPQIESGQTSAIPIDDVFAPEGLPQGCKHYVGNQRRDSCIHHMKQNWFGLS
jgi:hypothetical protein